MSASAMQGCHKKSPMYVNKIVKGKGENKNCIVHTCRNPFKK